MPRSSQLSFVCLVALSMCALGCSMIATMVHAWNPNDTKALYDGLRDKKTAVICRAESLEYSDPVVSRDLGAVVGRMLTQNDKKIAVIDHQELEEWTDANGKEDFKQIGRALKAEMVVGIELERFSIRQGSTLLQGQADLKIIVYDMKNGGRIAFEHRPKTIMFPPNGPIASSDRQEAEFRRQFIGIVAEQVAHTFYEYDSRAFAALDSTVLH
ncbi:MAG: hypothetical protein QM811_10490 [Pirellulales bacterium]